MKFLRLFKHLFFSIWRNATPLQAALITSFLLVIVVILIVSVVQVLIPFTYVAI